MQKQLFFIISLYLITYSFSADTDPCTTKKDSETCKADTTNNCEWKETKACAAATCTGLLQTPCEGIKSCAWDSSSGGSCGDADAACEDLTDSSTPKCGETTYCVWTAATGGAQASCDPVDCTKLDATDAACVGTKGCALTTTGSCAKKSTSGGDGGSNGSDSAFGLKTSLTLLIIGFLL